MLSFGGLQFLVGYFEFVVNFVLFYIIIVFCYIYLYEDMDIYFMVLVNEEIGYVEKLFVKFVKGGKMFLFVCEVGCQYDFVEVG